jgi:hypothetical protein
VLFRSGINVVNFTTTLTLSNGDDIVNYAGTNWTISQSNGAAVSPPVNIGNPATINALGGNDTFNITGGTVSAATTLNGDGNNDTLAFANTAVDFLGTFNGGSGTDAVDESAVPNDSLFTITGAGATDGLTGTTDFNPSSAGTGAIQNVDNLIGRGSPGSALTYSGGLTSAWAINGGGINSLTLGGQSATFSGLLRLTGGTNNDTFTFTRQDLLPQGYEIFGGGAATNDSLVIDNTGAAAADYVLSGDNTAGSLGASSGATSWADITFNNIGLITLTAPATGDTLDDFSFWTGTGFSDGGSGNL